MKAKHEIELDEIMHLYDIDVEGLDWDNLSIIGDKNIDIIINKISSDIHYEIGEILKQFDYDSDTIALKNEELKWKEAISSFIKLYKENRQKWIDMIESCKTGINKPVLPNLRDMETYKKYQHMIFLPNQGEVKSLPYRWHSAAFNYYAYQDCILIPCPKINDSYKTSYNGYYWAFYTCSCTFMSYDEYVWMKSNIEDKRFLDIWIKSSHRISMKIRKIQDLLDLPSDIVDDFDKELGTIKKDMHKRIKNTEDWYTKNYMQEFLKKK